MQLEKSSSSVRNVDLLCIGSVGADMLFLGLDRMPNPGELALARQLTIHPGGCATNTCAAYAKLGGRSRLLAQLGDDATGRQILEKLEQLGVITDKIITSQVATAVTAVIVFSNGERTFLYYPGCNALLSQSSVDVTTLTHTQIVHFADTFLLPRLDGEGTQTLLQQARVNKVKTSMDTSWDNSGRWLNLVKDYLPFVDLFFCSRLEAKALTGYENVDDAAQFLINYGPELVIIKQGERGSYIRGKDFALKIPAFLVPVVDTTGAGDCYVAAFLFGLLRGWDYERIGMFASAVGGLSVMAEGAVTGIRNCDYVLTWMTSANTLINNYV